MPRAEQYWRRTPEMQEAARERQRVYRLTKPSINGAIRGLFENPDDYYKTYKRLLKRQKGVCGICSKPPGIRRFDMDHDHVTLEIRGLLCYSCNTKLGFVEKYKTQIERYMTWS